MAQIMDTLMNHRATALPPKGLAEVFDRLIWCLDDQGTSLLRVREDWLESGDRDRVEVALAMDEVFPYADPHKMDDVFSDIAMRWPDLAGACDRIRDARAAIESK
jgi:hypothetical protein